MAKFEFIESDFKEFEQRLYPDNGCAEYIADKANARLKQMLAEAPTVYCLQHPGTLRTGWRRNQVEGDTHTAKLVCIEVIDGKV